MTTYLCDFCGGVVESPRVFRVQSPKDDYVHTDIYDMCPTCENIVVPASTVFIREVKKQCQKAKAAAAE